MECDDEPVPVGDEDHGPQCPSYAGRRLGAGIFRRGQPGQVAAGNYIAMPSTHYTKTGGQLATSSPSSSGYKAPSTDCAGKTYCGNGALPFPGTTGSGNTLLVTRRGIGFAQLQQDGSSKTILISESKEEKYTSWYSGFASYGVGPGGARRNR